MRKIIFLIFAFLFSIIGFSQPYSYQLAVLKYNGGNWYVSPTALPNLIKFTNTNLHTNINPQPADVEPGSSEIFNYPFIFMTGNGNVIFTPQEAQNLRKYLKSGGFLHINDSYGMDKFIRRELKKVFPDKQLVELPNDYPIYHQKFDFPKGLPKIHKHDGKRPQGFGLFYKGRLVIYYDYESDIGDGWEDPDIHHDSPEIRQKALEMGANLLEYVFMEDKKKD